jgi:hypothetical protein
MQYNEDDTPLDIWSNVFPAVPPLPWVLREQEQKNWFRLYSLPNGKRYATSREERSEIFHRNNLVYDTVFAGHEDEILIMLPVKKKFERFNRYKEKAIVDIGFEKSFDYQYDIDNEFFKIYFGFFSKKITQFNKIINLTSQDKIMAPIFWNKKDIIFSPYDGGIDIFVFDLEKLDNLKTKFTQWLSNHSSGL